MIKKLGQVLKNSTDAESVLFHIIDQHTDEKIADVKNEVDDQLAAVHADLSNKLAGEIPKVKDGKDGEKGDAGKDGERGEKGDPGEKGKDGKDGKDGRDGVDGKNGKDGVNGKDGKDSQALSAAQIVREIDSSPVMIPEDNIVGLVDLRRMVQHGAHDTQGKSRGGVKNGVSKTEIQALEDRVVILESAPAGSAGTPATTVTSETTYGVTPAVGASTDYARADHTHGTMVTPTKTTVGLANVDNTSDASKPVSTAMQTALDLKANASDVPVLASGAYAPAFTNVANLDSTPTGNAQYNRVGNVVTVSGEVSANPTLTATQTTFGISLPVASNFAQTYQCAGVAFCGVIAGMGAAINADVTNDRANVTWVASDPNAQTWSFTFSYLII